MKYTGLLSLTLFSCIAHSASHITYLNVDNGFVHFSTQTSKAASAPSCAVSDTNEQYAVSLANENGRAVYSLLITAMASSQAVDVVSAGDCADVSGIERASGVSLSPVVAAESKSSELYLYQGDNQTKIGRIVNFRDDMVYYLDGENDTEFKIYRTKNLPDTATLFFSGPDCQGTPYSNQTARDFINEHYKNGIYLRSASQTSSVTYWSSLSENGQCSTRTNEGTWSLASISEMFYLPCGVGPCRIREE